MKREVTLAVILFLGIVAVQVINNHFLSIQNISDLLIQISPFAILAAGMTFVMVLGEIDISIGSMAGLLSAILGLTASTSHLGLPPALCAIIVITSGALLGLLNGFLVATCGLPSIIVTLGMLTIFRGSTEILMGGQWIKDLPPGLRFIGTGKIGIVPIPTVVAVVTVGLLAVIASWTPFGRRVNACGSNPHAAELRGLPVAKIRILAFVLLGALTGLATLISVPQLSVVESGFGNSWELFVVTCVVVGGVSVRGGSGTVVGVVLAVILLSIVRTSLVFMKLGDQAVYWERSIQGAFILVAVVVDRLYERRGREILA